MDKQKGMQTEPTQEEAAFSAPSVSHVKNKNLRRSLNARSKNQKKTEKRKRREKRKREQELLGDEAPPAKQQRTLENTREKDETIVQPDDTEVVEDEAMDEFSDYFQNKKPPKILITTSPDICTRSHDTVNFIKDLVNIIPSSEYRERKSFTLAEIAKFSRERDYTDIIVINEDRKKPNGVTITHLPSGPTALFKLTSIITHKEIHHHAKSTEHYPELILNNFNTRLGHTIGRMLGVLVPQMPDFPGRRVITFHNQRDFIFFRHHRYIFDNKEKARLQEIGPRFTLKLKCLQHGTFDDKFREYEWVQKPDMVTSRRRFFI